LELPWTVAAGNASGVVTALANANIALIKYWGKKDPALNLPAAGSLSLVLDALQTTTQVSFIDGPQDELILDGRPTTGKAFARMVRFVDLVRAQSGQNQRVRMVSANEFPTAAGLASSASAFAAMALAVSQLFGQQLSPRELSILARRGSGSAARSVPAGFARMYAGSQPDGSDAYAENIPDIPLNLYAVIAVASAEPKKVGSTDGMEHTRLTSPYHSAWLAAVDKDLSVCEDALRKGDIDVLAQVVEGNTLAMHANAMAARPGIIYFQSPTLWALEQVRAMRAEGTPVFFTVDAGPHLVAFTLPEHVEWVAARLATHPEISKIITSGVGLGARLQGA